MSYEYVAKVRRVQDSQARDGFVAINLTGEHFSGTINIPEEDSLVSEIRYGEAITIRVVVGKGE